MNKILRLSLLSFLMVFCGTAFAQETKIVCADNAITVTDNGFTLEVAPFSFEAFKNAGQTKPTQNANFKDIRLYAKNSLNVSTTASGMTKMVFTISAAGKKRWVDVTASVGSINADVTAGTLTWTSSAPEQTVTFTVGETSTLGTEAGKAGQFDFDDVTITAAGASGKKSAELVFDPATIDVEKGTEFTAPVFTKATTAAVRFSSDNEGVATVDANGVISLGLEEGTAVITAASDENAEFYAGKATCTINVFTYNTYKKATTIESGKEYLLVAQRDGNTYYAMPLTADKNYGYLNSSKIDGLTDEVKVKNKYQDGFIFTTEGTGYSIKDVATSRYLIQQGTYKSFNTSAEPVAWNVEAQADGTFKIEMNGYTMQWGEGTYTSFGVYTEMQENAVMPYLYVLDNTTSGISNPAVNVIDENAPIYNLAGQRVSKDAKGILIRNGRKFISK
ncbi:MAG: Ig-like domain-containing protein [Prevotella sp.]|nr:Ig-like domain-containing protein [Prevotella sp.]